MSDRGHAPRRFIVLAAPRTGSNWLCSRLDSHPEILCHHELFNPEGVHLALRLRGDGELGEPDLEDCEERDRDPLGYLERVFELTLGARAVGFKLNRGQNEKAFEAMLGDAAVRKIVLRRENRLKVFVSEQIALSTGHWESYPDSPRSPEQKRIHLDLAALERHLERNRKYYEALEEALAKPGQKVLELRYEDLVAGRDWDRALDFLGVGPAELRAETRKQNSRDLREIVINFDEVAAALRGTELEAQLHSREA